MRDPFTTDAYHATDATAFAQGYLQAIDFVADDELRGANGFALTTKATIIRDCEAFFEANYTDINLYCELTKGTYQSAGTDFYFTRNRHGAGFWDRGNGEVFDRLTEASHAYGSSEEYAGDDGLIYCNS